MFLSWQTHEGLQVTLYSVIEATRFLLTSGMKFVLTSRFNQENISVDNALWVIVVTILICQCWSTMITQSEYKGQSYMLKETQEEDISKKDKSHCR